jgi:hypothetical protein
MRSIESDLRQNPAAGKAVGFDLLNIRGISIEHRDIEPKPRGENAATPIDSSPEAAGLQKVTRSRKTQSQKHFA